MRYKVVTCDVCGIAREIRYRVAELQVKPNGFVPIYMLEDDPGCPNCIGNLRGVLCQLG